jgi:hypothetical protein
VKNVLPEREKEENCQEQKGGNVNKDSILSPLSYNGGDTDNEAYDRSDCIQSRFHSLGPGIQVGICWTFHFH